MQPVASMTGFARLDGDAQGLGFAWELRSVNNRGLDLRLRLAAGFEGLEPRLRKEIGATVTRGSIAVQLSVTQPTGQTSFRINTEALRQILALLRELDGQIEAEPPRLDGLLALRGVLETVDETQDFQQRQSNEEALFAAFKTALYSLVEMRRSEGSALAGVVASRLDQIAELTQKARGCASLQPEALRKRLRLMVTELLESAPTLPEDRLAHEAALLI